jgi:poly(3-hydroxybutyrate) depolymerase
MTQDSNDLPGRLFVPTNYNDSPNQTYAVVVYLHGLGQQGSEDVKNDGVWNTAQLGGSNELLAQAKSQHFFLYAPQTWGGWGTDPIDSVLNQIKKMSKEYRIDTSRIYITGISLGGGGTMDAIARYPQVFAAASNMSGSDVSGISTTNYGNRLKDTPLWIFQGYNDATVPRSVPRNRFNAILAAKNEPTIAFPGDVTEPVSPTGNGADVNYPSTGNSRARYWQSSDGLTRYTEYATGGHGISGRAYSEAALNAWMFSKTRQIPALQIGQTIKMDVGFYQLNTTNATGFYSDGTATVWNSTTYGIWSVVGPAHSFLKTTTGQGTSVSLEIIDPFENEYTLPSSTSVNDRLNKDGWRVNSSNPAEFQFTGLTPGWKYDVELYAYRENEAGTTRFIIDGSIIDISHNNNPTSNLAVFDEVVADDTGAITIQVQAAPGSFYGYLSWASITASAVPEPASMLLPAAGAFVLMSRRRRTPRSENSL